MNEQTKKLFECLTELEYKFKIRFYERSGTYDIKRISDSSWERRGLAFVSKLGFWYHAPFLKDHRSSMIRTMRESIIDVVEKNHDSIVSEIIDKVSEIRDMKINQLDKEKKGVEFTHDVAIKKIKPMILGVGQ